MERDGRAGPRHQPRARVLGRHRPGPGPPESIGDTLDRLRGALDPWLGTPQRKFKEGRVNLVHRFDSADSPPIRLRLKIEINSRGHFTELGLVKVPFEVDSRWFRGSADVTTFPLDELLGTKLRALYQRKKGRELFDLYYALTEGKTNVDAQSIEAVGRNKRIRHAAPRSTRHGTAGTCMRTW